MAEKIHIDFAFVTRQSLLYTMVYPRGTVSGAPENLAWSHNSDLEWGVEVAGERILITGRLNPKT